MKCLISRQAFKKRLVAAVVPRQTPKPILATVRLEVVDAVGTLGATDLETWARIEASRLPHEPQGQAQLPVRALLAALGNARDRELQLDYDPEAFSLASDTQAFSLVVAG